MNLTQHDPPVKPAYVIQRIKEGHQVSDADRLQAISQLSSSIDALDAGERLERLTQISFLSQKIAHLQ